MNTRIKELRTKLNKSQAEFAEMVGVSQGAVWFWESGKQSPPEQAVRIICQTFGVNRKWLESGIGDMFEDFSEENNRAKQRSFIASLIEKLTPEQRTLLVEAMQEFLKKHKE